jgi:demethylmenaquinone methyltransferase/2-methoxy-6-polyprenyl-1,4-benzoquinol methylase
LTDSEQRRPGAVQGMFDRIAPRYDLLNHLLSANLDRGWRRAAAAEGAAGAPADVLDLCGGTGDMSLAVARESEASRIVCCDFSLPMLERAAAKFQARGARDRCLTAAADGLRLPFSDGSFDAVTVAFGVRNFSDMDAGFREIHRVLAPGGRMVVLEFSVPTGPVFGRLYRTYLTRLLPAVGDRITGHDGPYGYLARTISGFPEPPILAGRIRDAGFAACGWKTRTGGIVAIHTAIKGGLPASGSGAAHQQ